MESVNRGDSEIDQLIRNAELRTELEPYLDEALYMVDTQKMPTSLENEFLASILAWESAPVLPIGQWFDPPLMMRPSQGLTDKQVTSELNDVIEQLYQKNIVLQCTEHLSDRELYQMIACEILPSKEKKVDLPGNVFTWHCVDQDCDSDLWLRYYASEEDRDMWQEFNPGQLLPPREIPPYPRILPGNDGP